MDELAGLNFSQKTVRVGTKKLEPKTPKVQISYSYLHKLEAFFHKKMLSQLSNSLSKNKKQKKTCLHMSPESSSPRSHWPTWIGTPPHLIRKGQGGGYHQKKCSPMKIEFEFDFTVTDLSFFGCNMSSEFDVSSVFMIASSKRLIPNL